MMLKLKTYFTIFSVYEIAAIILLHCRRTCDAMFGAAFCDDHVFKYFIWCVAVPLVAFLIAMWVHEIVTHNRRRRMITMAKTAAKNLYEDVRDRVTEQVSPQDVAGLVAGAVLYGIKKFSDRHGKDAKSHEMDNETTQTRVSKSSTQTQRRKNSSR